MRLDDLEELYLWCVAHRVLNVEVEGMKLVLDASALPVIVMAAPVDSKEPGWDDDVEPETPQARARREWAEKPPEERDG